MPELSSEGKCLYCNQEFKKTSIIRHLDKHLSEKINTCKPGRSFLVKIEPDPKWGASPYFLSVWIDGSTTMEQVDIFLREIWLECCGHLSAFKKQSGEISKSGKAKDILYKDLKLIHEYDFGSTTKLQLTVSAEYPARADKNIVLLSRNEPPEFLCETCKVKPATHICTSCGAYEDASAFCNACAKKHGKICPDFNDYSSMPVVNSPRMGVCGYIGGIIDTGRDGVFVKK